MSAAELAAGAVLALLAGMVPTIVMTEISPPQMRSAMNQWLRWGLVGASAAAWRQAPFLIPIAVYLAARWPKTLITTTTARFPHEQLPSVMAWVGIGATWLAVQAAPPLLFEVAPVAWAAVGTGHALVMLWQRLLKGPGGRIYGGLAQRTMAGAFFAMALAVGPWWTWGGLLLGLWLSGPSWVAALAFAAAACVRWPAAAPWVGAGLAAAVSLVVVERLQKNARIRRGLWGFSLVERLTPRGDTLDTLRERGKMLAWAAVTMAEGRLWLWGSGPGTMGRITRQWAGRSNSEPLGNLHCEPAQVVFEYGLFGLAALVLFSWRVASGLELGDPWSAGVVAGAVVALGSLPCRIAPVGVVWLILCAGVAR